MRATWLVPFLFFVALPASAQTKPTGQEVLNQGKQGAVLAAEQNFPDTRGIYVGKGTTCPTDSSSRCACDLSVVFSKGPGNGPVILYNLVPGTAYPFQIRRINSAGSSCLVVDGIW